MLMDMCRTESMSTLTVTDRWGNAWEFLLSATRPLLRERCVKGAQTRSCRLSVLVVPPGGRQPKRITTSSALSGRHTISTREGVAPQVMSALVSMVSQ